LDGIHADHICCSISFGAEFILSGCIYRPSLSVRAVYYLEIITLSAIIAASKSKSKYNGILICGDFNHPSLIWSNEDTPFINASELVVILSVNYTVMLSAL